MLLLSPALPWIRNFLWQSTAQNVTQLHDREVSYTCCQTCCWHGLLLLHPLQVYSMVLFCSNLFSSSEPDGAAGDLCLCGGQSSSAAGSAGPSLAPGISMLYGGVMLPASPHHLGSLSTLSSNLNPESDLPLPAFNALSSNIKYSHSHRQSASFLTALPFQHA